MVADFTFALYGAQLVFGMFGGLLVGLGLLTRLAAFVLSGEMAFAFFLAHFPQGWNPILNGGETAVLFCFTFLYISTTGAGPFSLDRILQRLLPESNPI